MVLALQDEIRRSHEARYDHRLHAVLLVAQGGICPEVAAILGDSIRTVQYWVNRFETEGFAGLADADRPGRSPKLVEQQLDVINNVLRKSPINLALAQIFGTARHCHHLSKNNSVLFLACDNVNDFFANSAFVCGSLVP